MGMEANIDDLITKTNKELYLEAMQSGNYNLLCQASDVLPKTPGVYAIFNKETNRIYIGSSRNVYKRVLAHLSALRYGEHLCSEMNLHFYSNSDSFSYFFIDGMDVSMIGEKGKNLLIFEAKIMLLAPKEMLYNNQIPILSEGEGEFSTDPVTTISVSEICRNIDMTADAIRANGLSFSDSMLIDDAIEFVRNRTVARGRWTVEKAEKSILYLAELEKIKSESSIQIYWEHRKEHEKEPIRDQVRELYKSTLAVEEGGREAMQSVPASTEDKFETVMKAAPAPKVARGNFWLLWLCLAFSVASSVPNMYSVMIAIKGDWRLAGIVTAAFTIAPFLLIAYGVNPIQRIVVYAVICIEVFCNAAGFFGGMTGLGHSLYVEPTTFLHMVTSMTNSANEPTAFILAVCMAVGISLLAIVPVYELGKIGRK
jgi:GIY-YIG catalytic domain